MKNLTVFYNSNWDSTRFCISKARESAAREEISLTVIGSHRHLTSPMLEACDIRLHETTVEAYRARSGASLEDAGRMYAEQMADICDRYQVDVFVPRAYQSTIARHLDLFDHTVTSVMSMPADRVATLEDKNLTYVSAIRAGFETPPWVVVRKADDLDAARRTIGKSPLVIKPTVGVGAEGFLVLVDSYQQELPDEVSGTRVKTFDEMRAALTSPMTASAMEDLIVMPYLEAPEVSVDVIAKNGRLVTAIPRVKRSATDRDLLNDHRVLALTRQYVEHFGIEHFANLQFRRLDGKPVLLEINSRPAGGVWQCAAAGVDYHWEGIRLAAGESDRTVRPTLGVSYSILGPGTVEVTRPLGPQRPGSDLLS